MNIRNTKRSETTEQIRVIEWAKHHEDKYPALKWLFHIPNGGKRNQREAVVLKQMGVKPGVSDLFLPQPAAVFIEEHQQIGHYNGLFIEMKYGDGKVSKQQKEFLYDMMGRGYFVATCYSYNQAVEVIAGYLTNRLKKTNNREWKDEIYGQ